MERIQNRCNCPLVIFVILFFIYVAFKVSNFAHPEKVLTLILTDLQWRIRELDVGEIVKAG